MKIGLSLSRCVRDIVEGHVAAEDVLVLITRTDFDPTVDSEWQSIWRGYNYFNPEWAGLVEDDVKSVIINLWNDGKIHQPRKFGASPRRRPEYWLEAVLLDSELESCPAAKEAWDKFQVIAGLSNIGVDREYQ